MTTTGGPRPIVPEWQQLCMMSLADLTVHCATEMNLFRRKEVFNDQYGLEILRRAVVKRDNDARSLLQQLFRENVLLWIRCAPQRETALDCQTEQEYVDETFTHFWQAISDHAQTFTTLPEVLRCLHLCLNCVIMEILRADSRAREVSLPDVESPQEEDHAHKDALWEVIKGILSDEKERRVAFLYFHCHLKPSEIVRTCPDEFRDEAEVSRLKCNLMDRIVEVRPRSSPFRA